MISGVSMMQMELRYPLSVGSPEAKEIDSSERRALTESLREGFDVARKCNLILPRMLTRRQLVGLYGNAAEPAKASVNAIQMMLNAVGWVGLASRKYKRLQDGPAKTDKGGVSLQMTPARTYSSVYQLADSWSHKPEVASSSLAAAPNSDALAHGVITPSYVLGISSFSGCLSGLRAGPFYRFCPTIGTILQSSTPLVGLCARSFSELRRFAACVRPLIFSFNSVAGLKVSGSNPGHSSDSITLATHSPVSVGAF